jgi:deoxyribodipyrimidine photo-lyase
MTINRKYERIIVWIRRELRVQDHLALWSAVQDAKEIIPLYVIGEEFTEYAPARKKVIVDSLRTLSSNLKRLGGDLVIRNGDAESTVLSMLREYNADGIYLTKDYSPDARRRDAKLRDGIERTGYLWREFKDAVLFEEREILSSSRNEPFTLFTPYKNAWRSKQESIPPVLPLIKGIRVPNMQSDRIPDIGNAASVSAYPIGGEEYAQNALREFLRSRVDHYHEERNILAADGTSRLSHHLAVGNISARTVYHAIREKLNSKRGLVRQGADAFLNEIIWREFYYQILANFPHVAVGSFKLGYDRLSWSQSDGHFEQWCRGETGYPIVDAAMRQLNTEGWMHNRARMIVANFLTKDLHVDWRKGEAYFMSRLADGDLALNNGGWQWCAGTGNDAQPWFRIFNPVLQAKKFDPSGEYVRRYIPELSEVPVKFIHEPWLMPKSVQESVKCVIGKHYPPPVVQHDAQRKVTLARYQRVARDGKINQQKSPTRHKRSTERIKQ